jgi:hypothetical protein
MTFAIGLVTSPRYNLRKKTISPLPLEEREPLFNKSLVRNFVVDCCTEVTLEIVDTGSPEKILGGEITVFVCADHVVSPCDIRNHSSFTASFGNDGVRDFGACIRGKSLNSIGVKFQNLYCLNHQTNHLTLPCKCISFLHVMGTLNGETIDERLAMRLTNKNEHIVFEKKKGRVVKFNKYLNCQFCCREYIDIWKTEIPKPDESDVRLHLMHRGGKRHCTFSHFYVH